MSIVSNPYGATLAAIVPPVMPAFEWNGPLFAIRKEGWEVSLPPNMTIPPAPAHRGVAQLFAEDGALPGKRAVSLAFVTAGADENAGDAAKPRFPSPQDAARYVDYGWKLYWTPQDEGIRDGIIREIRGVADLDIDRLVESWRREEPYGYISVFLFALAGHKYARKKFVEFTLKKIPPSVKDIAGAILDNILPKTQTLCNETNENVHTDLFCMIRGLVLVLCDLVSRGDKKALESVSKYFNILSQADSQLSKGPKEDRRYARVRASLKSLRDEAVYLLSEADPDKFLDDPVRNRRELDFLAGQGNRRVLETYAQYAARGCLNSLFTVLNAAIDLCRRDVFDLLMDAARKEPSILMAITGHPESRVYKYLLDIVYGTGGEEIPQSQMTFLAYVARKLKEFDFGDFSSLSARPPLMNEIVFAMTFLGNRSAITMAVRLTTGWLEEGVKFAKEAKLLTAPLQFIVRAREEGDTNADELIKNLAKLGHRGAQDLAAGGPVVDKTAN